MTAYCQKEDQISVVEFRSTEKRPVRYCHALKKCFSVVPEDVIIYLLLGDSVEHHRDVVETNITPDGQCSFDGMY